MHALISAIEYYLPEKTLTTEELDSLFPSWSVAAIDAKTGIHARHIARTDEYASDLAFAAAKRLFASGVCRGKDIDFLLLCTQSADYALPPCACVLQDRLGIPDSAGAVDYNLGCSGYVYGLGLSEGLIASGQASAILLVTSDTYSRYISPSDKTTRTLFGDGATATLIEASSEQVPFLGPFVYGTDGRGAGHLIVPNSGTRRSSSTVVGDQTIVDSVPRLYMNGYELFRFAIGEVPRVVAQILTKAGVSRDDIDLFVFHQANKYILDELRCILEIPVDKFQITLRDCANTVSSTIPIALKYAELEGKLMNGSLVMLVSFGVGFSWGATLVRWRQSLV